MEFKVGKIVDIEDIEFDLEESIYKGPLKGKIKLFTKKPYFDKIIRKIGKMKHCSSVGRASDR